MTEGKPIQVSKAKGRPMLTWVGKRPLTQATAYPAQLVESYSNSTKPEEADSGIWNDWPSMYPKGGILFHGDNKEVLAHLLANGFRGKVKLIYIDPPFDSGADYVRRVTLRGPKGIARLEGDSYSLGEQIQYADIWANDTYLQFMYERLSLLKELLSDDGTIYLHCDDTKGHLLRCLLDEVFGADNFMNEVLWVFRERGISTSTWNRKHNNLYVYAKRLGSQVFNVDSVRDSYSEETKRKFRYEDENGRYQIRGRNIPGSPIKQADGLRPEHEEKYPGLTYRQYMQEGQLPVDWWEISLLNKAANERTDYPTQKPEELLYKIIAASSNPGDLVLDCFGGSGTTAAVAQRLGRRWLTCDINKGAIQVATKRLMGIIDSQAKEKGNLKLAGENGEVVAESLPLPTQLSMAVFRVNDYDLQIQHNEAVNLASEAMGIERTKDDTFFDGKLGKKLARIVPFNHPITQADLEEVKRELSARPQEDRDVVVVGLGKETATDEWLEEWNRLRKSTNVPNKIELVELRSDPRYGGFFQHEPADGKVTIARQDDKILVTVEEFISPTIIERLKKQAGVLTPQITDWRSMVDSVMIDLSYNGEVFNVAFADVPDKKSDLVSGKYELRAPEGETIVAVKITDMLGEEVLKTVKI